MDQTREENIVKTRVLKCQTCNRLTDIAELAKRPLPEVKSVDKTNRLGCRFCGNEYFRVEVVE